MDGQVLSRQLGGDGFDHGGGLAWRADADGIAQRNLIAAHFGEALGDFGNLGGIDMALIGASEDTGDIASDANAGSPRRFGHRPKSFETVGDTAIDVAPGKTLRCSGKYGDLLSLRRKRRFETAKIG